MRLALKLVAPILALAGCGSSTSEPTTSTIDESAATDRGSVAEFRPWQGSDTFVMIAPPELEAEQWRVEAKRHCEDREFCKVVGWVSEEEAASGFPMTDRETEAQAFAYSVNRVTGHDEALWDCSLFPRRSPEECLAK